jgi:adenylate cyclase
MDTKNLTIFFSDMVSFTKYSSSFSQQQLIYLLDFQDKIFLSTIKIYNGKVIKTIGDAYLVTFDSATNALLCAINIQEKINMHNSVVSKDKKFMVRIALNCGDVTVKNNDIFGTPVNIASRVQCLAKPGEIYLTQAVNLALNRNEIPFAKIGKKKLKGIPKGIELYKVEITKRLNKSYYYFSGAVISSLVVLIAVLLLQILVKVDPVFGAW